MEVCKKEKKKKKKKKNFISPTRSRWDGLTQSQKEFGFFIDGQTLQPIYISFSFEIHTSDLISIETNGC